VLEVGKARGELCDAFGRALEQGVSESSSDTQAREETAPPRRSIPPKPGLQHTARGRHVRVVCNFHKTLKIAYSISGGTAERAASKSAKRNLKVWRGTSEPALRDLGRNKPPHCVAFFLKPLLC